MRHLLVAGICVITVAVSAYLGARQQEPARMRLQLVDSGGRNLSGIVRVVPREGKQPCSLAGLLPRMQGLSKTELDLGWHVVPTDGATIALPREAVRLEALAGLETRLARLDLDLHKSVPAEAVLKLDSVFRPETSNLVAGNTHLHLKSLTLEQADDYLLQVPPADGLRVLFISYLERFKDDLTYITNKYAVGTQPKLQGRGVLVNNGEEHRHNFLGWGEGYGHVMFLNINKFVQPVSLGPGITGGGFDDLPLRPGIDNARGQGGTIIWCHNTNGFEDVLNVLSGRVHALNVFDGSRTGTFEENYYRYLNIGIPLPISTGTDWFMYDFSRVYAEVPGKLTIPAWLDALKAGRCQATNGPLLALRVDNKNIGDTLTLTEPRMVSIEATARGRNDFQTLELVHNGKVLRTVKSSEVQGGFSAKLTLEHRLDAPGWYAVRIATQNKNELDRPLFAHTSPIHVDIAGKRHFDVEAAQALRQQIDEGRAAIAAKGRFSTAQAREQLLALYDEAARDLRERINRRGSK